ncbi:MAG: DUF402 domain-containing protein [Lachnospiraceae bacterium]|nr:DUF402 domain-containing protein [Lachnospiraceae bacterium]
MSELKALFRKRYVPNEITWLKDDKIVYADDDIIITHWEVLKPRCDFSRGESTYYRKKGIKVSRIYDKDGVFLHWYCDIIMEQGVEGLMDLTDECRLKNGADVFIKELDSHKNEDIIVFTDLLVDIIINPNGLIEVADLDEIADMLKQGMITVEQMDLALHTAHDYLALLYSRYSKDADFTSEDFVRP